MRRLGRHDRGRTGQWSERSRSVGFLCVGSYDVPHGGTSTGRTGISWSLTSAIIGCTSLAVAEYCPRFVQPSSKIFGLVPVVRAVGMDVEDLLEVGGPYLSCRRIGGHREQDVEVRVCEA
jgi:hypothetical protein